MTEKSEQKKLLEKASAKNEQEIIEEIYLTSMRSQNWKNTKSSTILAISKALQKGKELGANECILEGKPDKGHPIPVYCPACFDESIEEQASKIAELEKENKELLETLQSVLCQACESRAATDTEPPEYDSMALSAYADGLRLLSKYKRFRIHDESGRRVIGYMR